MSQAFQTIPEAIAAWAQQTPDRVALLSAGHEPISYRQLVEQAHHLCRALDAKSITPSQRVALCIEDRPSLALCLLGLLFHGAAAIPIDPFSGNALVFRRHGQQHLLYSIGLDLEDNGGKTAPEKELRWDRALDVRLSSFSS